MSKDRDWRRLLSALLSSEQEMDEPDAANAQEDEAQKADRFLQNLRKKIARTSMRSSERGEADGDLQESMEKRRRQDFESSSSTRIKKTDDLEASQSIRSQEKDDSFEKRRKTGICPESKKGEERHCPELEKKMQRRSTTDDKRASTTTNSSIKKNMEQFDVESAWRKAANAITSIFSGPIVSENGLDDLPPSIDSALNSMGISPKNQEGSPLDQSDFDDSTASDHHCQQEEDETNFDSSVSVASKLPVQDSRSKLPVQDLRTVSATRPQPTSSAYSPTSIQDVLLPSIQMLVASTLSNSILSNLHSGQASSLSPLSEDSREVLEKAVSILLEKEKERLAVGGTGVSRDHLERLRLIEEVVLADYRARETEHQRQLMKKAAEDSMRLKKAIEDTLKMECSPKETKSLVLASREDKDSAKNLLDRLFQSTAATDVPKPGDQRMEPRSPKAQAQSPKVAMPVASQHQFRFESSPPRKVLVNQQQVGIEPPLSLSSRERNLQRAEKLLSQSDPSVVNDLLAMLKRLKETPLEPKDEQKSRALLPSECVAQASPRGSIDQKNDSSEKGPAARTSVSPKHSSPTSLSTATYASKPAPATVSFALPPGSPVGCYDGMTVVDRTTTALTNPMPPPLKDPVPAPFVDSLSVPFSTRTPASFQFNATSSPENKVERVLPPWYDQGASIPGYNHLRNTAPPPPIFGMPAVNEAGPFPREKTIYIDNDQQTSFNDWNVAEQRAAPPWSVDAWEQIRNSIHGQDDYYADSNHIDGGYYDHDVLVEEENCESQPQEALASPLYIGGEDDIEQPFHQSRRVFKLRRPMHQQKPKWSQSMPWPAKSTAHQNKTPFMGNRQRSMHPSAYGDSANPVHAKDLSRLRHNDLRLRLAAKRNLPPNDLRRKLPAKRIRANINDFVDESMDNSYMGLPAGEGYFDEGEMMPAVIQPPYRQRQENRVGRFMARHGPEYDGNMVLTVPTVGQSDVAFQEDFE